MFPREKKTYKTYMKINLKIILTLVKMVQKTLFKVIAIGVNASAIEERARSSLNTTRTGGDLQPTSRIRGLADGKVVRRDIKHRRILAKLT